MKKWIVKQMNNLTAYDTFNEDTHSGPVCEEDDIFEFDSFEEAEEFYRGRKAMLRFAGTPGMYYTYPTEKEIS